MTPNYTDILYTVSDQVCTIAINRPQKLNAMTGQTIRELEDAIRRASESKDSGVVVLTGVGEKAFCAGGDVKWEADGGLEDLDFRINRMLVDCPKPTVARVNGYAIASGNHIAYFCDLTIAADHAIFGQNGPRVGSPASGHLVSHLADIVGHKRAREMWLLCGRYSADKMLDWGLVNAVVPMADLDAEVRRWCDQLLAVSPTCQKLLKKSFQGIMDWTPMKEIIDRHAPGYFASGEQQEGAAAFLEKRKPDFSRWR
ncbi:enoyl-CoA hydratase-related protein [Ramlibacter sp.]|uniref:enoyl-CoA hydratase-related protein n=1 Tax=Ramlibacter sp. TaxID=1917967 RepID=UPI003D0CC418